ncbi:hypothetical protein SVAN01_04291 [Stagonosporopsis vannaccii]|nr:hypothetical protein SVAN01_04291 [Stagonosporopsis vannaccii]
MGWKVFDCAEFTGDCAVDRPTVPADPDVAGIGIIVGFLSTTCLAFLIAFTVMFLDRFNDIVNFCRRTFTNNKTPYEQNHDDRAKYWRSVAFWSRVLSKNLLAFSDTQLLTGLAIQFTALIKHCSMSVYHFRIVTDLAFLTTVTHLVTVVALRNYFVKNKWINLPRIFFMLANLALLGYTSFVSYSYDIVDLDLSDHLACFFKGERPRFKAAFGGKWAALLIGAIGGHVTVIAAMYWLKDPDPKKKGAWWWWIWYLGAAFRTWVVAPAYSIYGIYMAGDGLQYTQALGNPPEGVVIEGDESAWNFGQFLPVLLLALPIFAGWESFWEEKDEDRENRFGRHLLRKSRNTLTASSFDMGLPRHENKRGHSTEPSVEEQRIESSGPSPANTPRITPHASPHLRSVSEGTATLRPSPGSDMLLSVPIPAAAPGLGLNFSRPTPPRTPPRSPSRPRGSTT